MIAEDCSIIAEAYSMIAEDCRIILASILTLGICLTPATVTLISQPISAQATEARQAEAQRL